jgi:hypothetical protein
VRRRRARIACGERAGRCADLRAVAAGLAYGPRWGVPLACAILFGSCTSTPPTPAGSPGVLAGRAPTVVEPWTFQNNRGRALTTEHFRVLTTVEREILVGRVPGFVEGSLERFRAAFPSLPVAQSGMEVFILESRPEWERFVGEVYGAEGLDRYRGIDRGGFTERGRSVLWDIGVQDTFAILAHEGWHQYAQVSLREPLPSWLDEGIGAWAEGYRWDTYQPDRAVFLPWANVERFDQLRRVAERDGLMPLDQLLTERPQQLIRVSAESTLTYYAQCWALVHYLMHDPGRRAALQVLLADAAAGRVYERVRARFGDRAARSAMLRRAGPEVWQVYFGEDLAAADARFGAFVGSVVSPGAKNAVVQGRSPLE